jgi:RNA-directed DNA polymerase
MKPEASARKGPKPGRRKPRSKAGRPSGRRWKIVERDNLRKALAQVKRIKGAAGVDGMSLSALAPYLKEHWPTIRAQLLDGTYEPQPVRRVEIPKASGGTRRGHCCNSCAHRMSLSFA